jgi:hypothetical protein
MKPATLLRLSATLGALAPAVPPRYGETAFAVLSQDAQDLIVGAILGEFDSGPPEMSPEVREEITQWAEEEGGLP